MPGCRNERAIPSGFALRVAAPEDAAAVGEVLAASYDRLLRGWYRDDVLDRALPSIAQANDRLLASGRYFIVETAGCVISVGGWSFERPGAAQRGALAHLRHFATHPDFIGRGAASAIAARCEAEARAAGASEIETLSTLAAEAFYAGHGFNAMAVVHAPIAGTAFACVLMRKPLDR